MPTRTRTQGSIDYGSAYHSWHRCTPDGMSSYEDPLSDVLGPRSGTFKTVVDVHPSTWKSRQNDGSYTSEPFLSSQVSVEGGGAGFARTLNGVVCNQQSNAGNIWKDDFGHFFHSVFDGGLPIEPTDLIDETSLRSDAWQGANAQAKSPMVEGLVIVGELQQTINMLRHPLARSREIISRYRHLESKRLNLEDRAYDLLEKAGNMRNPKKLQEVAARLLERSKGIDLKGSRSSAKAAANAHLEFIFGIKPLMHDVQDIVRALTHERRITQRYKSSSSDTAHSTSTGTYNNGVDVMSTQTVVDQSVLAKAGVAYSYEVQTFNQKYGLDLRNIPASLWELLPYSFVVDWFYNIGKSIVSAVPQSGSVYLGGYSTIIRETTIHRDITSHESGLYWSIVRGCRDWETVKYKTIHRLPEGEAFRLPRFRYTLNIGQVLSAISLITQKAL